MYNYITALSPLFFILWNHIGFHIFVRRKGMELMTCFDNDGYAVQALLDGELGPEEEQCLKRKIEKNQKLQEHYKKLFLQKMLLRKWWQSLH